MLYMAIPHIISDLTETLTGCKPKRYIRNLENCIITCVDIRTSYFDFADDGNTRLGFGEKEAQCWLYFMTSIEPGSNKVWSALIEDHKDMQVSAENLSPTKWEFLSNHDSCWRESISSECFRAEMLLQEKVTAHIPQEHRLQACQNLHHFNTFNFSKVFQHAVVMYDRVEGYRQFLVTSVKFKE